MGNEKMRILEMIKEGKLTANEGLDLLNALEDTGDKGTRISPLTGDRFLRVRVSGEKGMKANVNVPMKLIKAVTKFAGFGMSFIPPEARAEMEKKGFDLTQMDFDELVRLIDEGLADTRLVDVDVDDPKEGKIHVEVYVD